MGLFSSKITIPYYKDGMTYQRYQPTNTLYHNASIGEQKVAEVLRKKRIPFIHEFHHPNVKWLRYDFCFCYKGKPFLLEFDGRQHFDEYNFYTTNIKDLHSLQNRDRLKAQLCKWLHIYHIRIDYTQLRYIEYHINTALQQCNPLYLSTQQLYSYLKPPNKNTIDKYLIGMPSKFESSYCHII